MFQLQSASAHPVPVGGVELYKSYSVLAPPRSHFRKATCEEYECIGWKYGFVTTVDLSTDLGQRQYHFLTHDKKRTYSMQRVSLELVKFIYKPGTICMDWDSHRVPIGRPPRLYVADGDWRGNPTGRYRIHDRIEHWVEDFGLNQNKLLDLSKMNY
jgi:hypothetical protein